ncbi:MAG: hypothetical protein GY913_12170 [Proteobacteria bacterium]|nr:hypothetical protein [Pseudomonadota bacterium]MCP4917672.1 hypothetical protein [Pseudomonadota bacterium]
MTGVSAWGFFGILRYQHDDDWEAAAHGTADYLDGRLQGLLDDPEDLDNSVSCPNFTYLAWYLEDYPDAELEDRLVEGMWALLEARDQSYGDGDEVLVDGLLDQLAERRSTIPGIIPWDTALCVEALSATSAYDPDLLIEHRAAVEHMTVTLSDEFLPALEADASLAYADISVSYPLFVLVQADDPAHDELVDELHERMLGMMDPDGRITNGSDNDGPAQATAYGLLALKALESEDAQLVHDQAQAQIDEDGRVVDDETLVETFEVEGELLRALTYRAD